MKKYSVLSTLLLFSRSVSFVIFVCDELTIVFREHIIYTLVKHRLSPDYRCKEIKKNTFMWCLQKKSLELTCSRLFGLLKC